MFHKIDFTTLMSAQEKGTNSTPKLFIQTGWDYINSVSGTNTITKAMTFPVAYSRLVSIVVTPLGCAAQNATVNAPDDLTAPFNNGYVGFGLSNKTGFTAKIALTTGNFGANNERWGFSWVAFGVL